MISENECHFLLRQTFKINKLFNKILIRYNYILKVPAFSHQLKKILHLVSLELDFDISGVKLGPETLGRMNLNFFFMSKFRKLEHQRLLRSSAIFTLY